MLRAGVCINCAEKTAAPILESARGELAVEPCSGACREAIELYFSTPPERAANVRDLGPLESAKRETGTQDESNSEPSMAMAASLSGATTLTPPRSSRIQPRLAHARSCLLVLSRDMPII